MLFPLFWRFRDATTGASATLLLPLGGHRSGPRDDTTVGAAGVLAQLQARAAGARACSRCCYFGNNARQPPRRRVPAVLALRRRQVVDDGAGAALLLAAQRRDGYALRLAAAVLHGQRPRRQLRDPVPAVLALRQRAPRHVDHGHARSATTTATRRLELRRRPAGAAAVRALRARRARTSRWCRCSGTSADRTADKTTTVVVPYWHRRWGGETTDGLFPLLYYRRGARPGGSDETSFTLFPLVHYRRDADTRGLGDAAGRVGARARTAAAASSARTSGTTTRSCRSASSRCLHADVTRHATPASGRGSSGCGSRSTRPDAQARVLFPLFGALQRPSTRPTPGCSPPSSACAATNGDRVDALAAALLAVVVRRCKTTTVVGAVLRSHRARRAQLGARAARSSARATRSEHHGHPAAAHLSAARKPAANASGSGRRSTSTSTTRTSSTTTVFPLYWAWKRGSSATWRSGSRSTGTSPTPRRTVRGRWRARCSGRSSGTWRTRGMLPRLVLARLRQRLRVARVHAAVLPGERARPLGVLHAARRLPPFGAVAALVRDAAGVVERQHHQQLQEPGAAVVPAHQNKATETDDHRHPAAALRVALAPRSPA